MRLLVWKVREQRENQRLYSQMVSPLFWVSHVPDLTIKLFSAYLLSSHTSQLEVLFSPEY